MPVIIGQPDIEIWWFLPTKTTARQYLHTDRLRRLFACACARRCWKNMSLAARQVVVAVEQMVDNQKKTRTSLIRDEQVRNAIPRDRMTIEANRAAFTAIIASADAAEFAARYAADFVEWRIRHLARNRSDEQQKRAREKGRIARIAERKHQAKLFAGLIGADWKWQSQWQTSTVLTLAQQMYQSRDFSAMPIYADALQDAGCDNEPWLVRMRDSQWPWCSGAAVLEVPARGS